jgi:D-xylose ABC transporter substrate-binding protein
MSRFSENDIILKNYRIEKSIGQGAFGEVHLATHLGLNGKRAVKVLLRDEVGIGSTEYDEYRNRFRQESQLMEWFNHPNIIRVYDFQEEDNTLFLVMEYASGGSLQNRLDAARRENVPFPLEEVIRIGIEVAEGLAALHARDVIHRDLKPSNILFDAHGHAKVADLGLAQIPGGASMRSQLSVGRPHPGTPAYMSPEQEVAGSYLRPSSDVYALGLILFELLTGRSYKNLKPGTSIQQLVPSVPDWFNRLLQKMLSDSPKARPWDGSEVANDLRTEFASENSKTNIQTRAEEKGSLFTQNRVQQTNSENTRQQEVDQITLRKPGAGDQNIKSIYSIKTPSAPVFQTSWNFIDNYIKLIYSKLKLLSKKKKGWAIGIVFLLIATVLIWQMGSFSASNNENNSNNQNSTITNNTSSGESGSSSGLFNFNKKKVGLSFSDLNSVYLQNTNSALHKALEAKGYEVLTVEANHDTRLQNDQISQLVDQGVDGIIIMAEDGNFIVPVVENAVDKGVKVIALDRLISTPKISAYISFNGEQIGYLQAAAILKKLNIDSNKWSTSNPAKIVLLGGSPADFNAWRFRTGQTNKLSTYINSGVVKIITDQWVENWDPGKARSLMENIITAHNGEIDAVVASNDGTALGAIDALKASNINVPISGQDATEAGCNSIAKGELTVTVFKDIRLLPVKAANVMENLLNGQSIDGLEYQNLSELTGNNELTGTIPTIFLPLVSVTKENLYDVIVKSGFQTYDAVYKDLPENLRPKRP